MVSVAAVDAVRKDEFAFDMNGRAGSRSSPLEFEENFFVGRPGLIDGSREQRRLGVVERLGRCGVGGGPGAFPRDGSGPCKRQSGQQR